MNTAFPLFSHENYNECTKKKKNESLTIRIVASSFFAYISGVSLISR